MARSARRLTLGLAGGLCLVAVLAGTAPVAWRASKARYPGRESHTLEDLDPHFRPCAEAVVARLEAAGFAPLVLGGWRDDARQAYYHQRGWSQVRAGGLHGRTRAGRPAALAVDVVDAAPFALLWRHVAFFRALREACHDLGLVCGVDWSRRNPLWRRWDLGWDPGHVQAGEGRCR